MKFHALCALLLLSLCPSGFAQTPPAGHSPDWNAGYSAGWTAHAPAPPPATKPSAPPPSTAPAVLETFEMAPLISGATDNQVLTPPAAKQYTITGTPNYRANGVKWDAHFTPVYVTPAPGASSGIVIGSMYGPTATPPVGTKLEIDNANFIGRMPPGSTGKDVDTIIVFRAYAASPIFRNCTADHVNGFLELDRATVKGAVPVKDAGGADNAIVDHCSGGQNVGGDFVYNSCDHCTITVTVPVSLGQHNVRQDLNADGHVPTGNTYVDCELTNINGKETLAIRMGNDTLVLRLKSHGWARGAGQNTATGLGSNVRNVQWRDCIFDRLYPLGAQLTFIDGATGSVTGCIFLTDSKQVSISLGHSTTSIAIAGNTRVLTAPGISFRPQIWASAMVPPATVTGDQSTNVVTATWPK